MTKRTERDLDPSDSFRDAMRDLIAVRFGAVWSAVPDAIDGENPAGVKAVRVASRRLRAAMDVAVDCFPASWYKPLHAGAKEITAELGEVRDRDVMLEFLVAERDAAPSNEHAGIDRLIARLMAEREVARAEMLDYLARVEDEGLAAEAERRFGPAAAAPWSNSGGS